MFTLDILTLDDGVTTTNAKQQGVKPLGFGNDKWQEGKIKMEGWMQFVGLLTPFDHRHRHRQPTADICQQLSSHNTSTHTTVFLLLFFFELLLLWLF